jgi:hypothetical protein
MLHSLFLFIVITYIYLMRPESIILTECDRVQTHQHNDDAHSLFFYSILKLKSEFSSFPVVYVTQMYGI